MLELKLLYRATFTKGFAHEKYLMRGYYNMLTGDYQLVITIPHLDYFRTIEVYNRVFDTLEELKEKMESIYLSNEGKRINIEDFKVQD